MKHQYYDTIVAWASGKTIQYRLDSVWLTVEPHELPGFNIDGLEWRIKPEPEIRKYRVALFK